MAATRDPVCRARGHRDPSAIGRDLALDVRRYRERLGFPDEGDPPLVKKLSAVLIPALTCVLVHRVAHWLHANGWHGPARLVARLNTLVHKVTISPESCLAGGVFLPHPPGILFHGRAGPRLTLFSHATCTSDGLPAPANLDVAPQLGDGVTIGVHAAVVGPVRVGSGAQIGFKAMVLADVPAQSVVTSRSLRTVVRRPDEEPPP